MNDKPRLKLLYTSYDAGWEYEWWQCKHEGLIGFGGSAKEAFRDLEIQKNARDKALQPPASPQSPK